MTIGDGWTGKVERLLFSSSAALDMSDDTDEFGAYDFSEFTDEDLAAIDADLARAQAGPAIQIAIEGSPFNKFLSWKKHLAVTDLVSPLW
jgi:hypothetical protein